MEIDEVALSDYLIRVSQDINGLSHWGSRLTIPPPDVKHAVSVRYIQIHVPSKAIDIKEIT